ncbi:hypothetical protein TIFTF001_008675 [Ficus carica]|uniref:Uncharacterized protein n=1 Tax=Ficus carica TaxID=3494 RepID=A0AA88D1Y2_FICCA|nr:hypothetical protein TIFTF001_008675 [Ficus carica]
MHLAVLAAQVRGWQPISTNSNAILTSDAECLGGRENVTEVVIMENLPSSFLHADCWLMVTNFRAFAWFALHHLFVLLLVGIYSLSHELGEQRASYVPAVPLTYAAVGDC